MIDKQKKRQMRRVLAASTCIFILGSGAITPGATAVFAESKTSQVSFKQTNTDVKIDQKNFPDAAVRKALIENFQSDKITPTQIKETKELWINQPHAKNITGLEIFKNLETLNLSNTAVNNLDEINHFTKLKNLILVHTKAKKLDVANLNKLKSLDFRFSSLEEVVLPTNNHLNEIGIEGSHLASIDLPKETKRIDDSSNQTNIELEGQIVDGFGQVDFHKVLPNSDITNVKVSDAGWKYNVKTGIAVTKNAVKDGEQVPLSYSYNPADKSEALNTTAQVTMMDTKDAPITSIVPVETIVPIESVVPSEINSVEAKITKLTVDNDEAANNLNYFNGDVQKISGEIQIGNGQDADNTFNKINGTANTFSYFIMSSNLETASVTTQIDANDHSKLKFEISNIDLSKNDDDKVTLTIPAAENKYGKDFTLSWDVKKLEAKVQGDDNLHEVSVNNGMVTYSATIDTPNGHKAELSAANLNLIGAFSDATVSKVDASNVSNVVIEFSHPAIHDVRNHEGGIQFKPQSLCFPDKEMNASPTTVTIKDGYVPKIDYTSSSSNENSEPAGATFDKVELARTITYNTVQTLCRVGKELLDKENQVGKGLTGLFPAVGMVFDLYEMFSTISDLDKPASELMIEKIESQLTSLQSQVAIQDNQLATMMAVQTGKTWLGNFNEAMNEISPQNGSSQVKSAIFKGSAAMQALFGTVNTLEKNGQSDDDQVMNELSQIVGEDKDDSANAVNEWMKLVFNQEGEHGGIVSPLDEKFNKLQNYLLNPNSKDGSGYDVFDHYLAANYDWNKETFDYRAEFYNGTMKEYETLYAIMTTAIAYDRDCWQDQEENDQKVMDEAVAEGMNNDSLPEETRNSLKAVYKKAHDEFVLASANEKVDKNLIAADDPNSLVGAHQKIADIYTKKTKDLAEEKEQTEKNNVIWSYRLNRAIQPSVTIEYCDGVAGKAQGTLGKKDPDGYIMHRWEDKDNQAFDNHLSEADVTVLYTAAHMRGKSFYQELNDVGFTARHLSCLNSFNILNMPAELWTGATRMANGYNDYKYMTKWSVDEYATTIKRGDRNEQNREQHAFHLNWSENFWGVKSWRYSFQDLLDSNSTYIAFLSNCYDENGKDFVPEVVAIN